MNTNAIHNEDCLIGMSKIDNNSIDLILCDLPYGTSANKWHKKTRIDTRVLSL